MKISPAKQEIFIFTGMLCLRTQKRSDGSTLNLENFAFGKYFLLIQVIIDLINLSIFQL